MKPIKKEQEIITHGEDTTKAEFAAITKAEFADMLKNEIANLRREMLSTQKVETPNSDAQDDEDMEIISKGRF